MAAIGRGAIEGIGGGGELDVVAAAPPWCCELTDSCAVDLRLRRRLMEGELLGGSRSLNGDAERP